jgi:acetyltransferase-like isoleucine patch superfamily enzyme
MIFLPNFLRRQLHVLRLRWKFPMSVIYSGVTVDRNSKIGNFSVLFKKSIIYESSIGSYSYIQENTTAYFSEVGSFCSIARNVTIGLFVHPINMVSTSPVFYDATQKLPKFFVNGNLFPIKMPLTIIESDVWIGEGVKIRAGVKIGVGSVIGAGAVVTKDIPPYTIAAGVPCRLIRKRFEDSICDRLLASAWWKMSDDDLRTVAHLFPDPLSFLDAIDGKFLK